MAKLIVLFTYLFIMNNIGFVLMGLDKRKSMKEQWRIPERTMFVYAILGGALGVWAGMYCFRHKTRHWYFVVFMPLLTVGWFVIFVKLLSMINY